MPGPLIPGTIHGKIDCYGEWSMKNLRVLMVSADLPVEPIFKKAIEDGGHRLTICNPRTKEEEFLAEAESGGYDVAVLMNLGLPINYSLGLIAPLRLVCSAQVIVMSLTADRRKGSPRRGSVPFYLLPISAKHILDAVEEAAGMQE